MTQPISDESIGETPSGVGKALVLIKSAWKQNIVWNNNNGVCNTNC
jgi:hypothetical protein